MRIVLDAFWWVTGTQSLNHAVHGLIETWAEEHRDDELVIVVRRKQAAQISNLPSNVRLFTTRLWPQALVAMLAVPWAARRTRADAMLSHNFSPLFGRRRGVYLHDVMFASNPEWFSRKELLYYRWMLRSIRRAHVVFSSTNSERERILAHSDARHVVKAGMGLSAEVTRIDAPSLARPGLVAQEFLLTVGRLNVRKNLAMTLEGARKSGMLSPSFPLVVVGSRDGAWTRLPDWVEDAQSDGSVILTGFVSLDELRWLITNCRLFICLSLDEGFGLPPVEAQVLGAQVLVSDRPVFRENLDCHATFVDPLDPTGIGTAIKSTCQAGAVADRSQLSEIRAKHTWSRTIGTVRPALLGPTPTERE